MTMLNGEPVDTGVTSTASTPSASRGSNPPVSPPGTPLRNPVAAIMGVAGLVFAITFPPVGLILGIVSRVLARRVGDRHPFATAAIWVGAILTIVGVVAIGAVIWFTVAMTTAGIDYCVNGNGDGTFFGTPITCG